MASEGKGKGRGREEAHLEAGLHASEGFLLGLRIGAFELLD